VICRKQTKRASRERGQGTCREIHERAYKERRGRGGIKKGTKAPEPARNKGEG